MSRRSGEYSHHFKSIVDIMYGFGDVSTPLEESVAVVEELAILYMRDLAQRALEARDNSSTRKEYIRTSDVLFAVRKDRRKLWRGGEALAFFKAREDLKTETSIKDLNVARFYSDK
jgi:hypothetical protein